AEVVSHLPKIWTRFRKLLADIDRRRPDVAVLIDFPDWNLRLASELHRRKIPVVYYVSPQLWAWREQRIEQIRRYVSKMLVIFPFEAAWYRERGIEAQYVGHPLSDLTMPAAQPLRSPQTPVALLPGSRRKEISLNLPTLLEAARALGKEYQFFVPVASTIPTKWMVDKIHRLLGDDPGVNLKMESDARLALATARAAVVASGTATVEAALIGTPFVMVYRISPLSWKMGRRLVKVPHFAMPNLIAGRRVVPELVQSDFTADRVLTEIRKILPEGVARAEMLAGLAEVRDKLRGPQDGRTAADRAADAVLESLVVGR
ncbi:MAG TPA: lipid-A-disaccharide synthase, partial [Terriglobales bacterium]|nr:lipid-A-disaccharide synthase [Terriglobales bacterium]